MFFGTSNVPLTQSRILILRLDMTIRQIRKKIFKLFRPIIEQAPDISDYIDSNSSQYNEDNVIEAEYKYFFENENWGIDNEGFNNPLYKLEIYNN